MYDIIVIGGGPAGISAGIYGASRGQHILMIEKEQVGGIIGKVSNVTHYTSVAPMESGTDFAYKMKNQALNAGVNIVYETVTQVKLANPIKYITTNKNTYTAKKVILANGCSFKKLHLPNEVELTKKGMNMNALLDAQKYLGKNVYVVGGADGAVKEALYLSSVAKSVTIIHFKDKLDCISEFRQKVAKTENIRLCLNSRLHAIYGKETVERLDILDVNTNKITTMHDFGCGIFVYIGTTPNTEIYHELSLEDGYIPTNEKMETSIPGVYAAGDIRVKQVRQVATAVSDGAIAAINAAI